MRLEWIVEVDSDDNLVEKIERTPAHKQDDLKLHREIMVLLFADRDHNTFLLQHRSMKKKQLPGYWTLSATGHVDFDDLSNTDPLGYLSTARRETREEIGVEATGLKLVGQIEQKIPENWAMMGLVVGEYRGVLKLDPDEVSEVKIYDKKTVLEVSDKLTPGAKACLEYLEILPNLGGK